MADGGGGEKKYANFFRDASAILKGHKNAAGKGVNVGNRSRLASALMKGNAAKRNEVLAKFGAAYGVPAAAGAGAGAAVAAAVAGGPGPINSANKKAAQVALAAAIAAEGSARKPTAPVIAKYARLKKNGKNAEAANYLGKVVAAAVEANAVKGAKAAGAAAAKTLKKNATPSSNDEIKARLLEAGIKAGPVNVAYYREARVAGQAAANAIKHVQTRRANAHKKAGAARTAKALAKKAAAASAAAGGAGAAAAAPIVAAAKAAKAVGETGSGKAAKKNGPNSSNMTHRAPRGAAARPGSVLAGLMRRSSRRTRRRRN
jgi:hypothetical protein